jgi:hypothetical protein
MNDILSSLIAVTLPTPDSFLKIKETLTRIGVPSRKTQTLYQSCHILHKRGMYYIVHFKEMFALDGLPSTLSDDDIRRRNYIANLLEEWNLLAIVDKTQISNRDAKNVCVLRFGEKDQWNLEAKYRIGKK